MERKLLLLGMLRTQEMHGYQINQMLDAHLGASYPIKKPTVYKLLNQMVDDGWITFKEEQEGNYPSRRVYSIAPEGEAAFQRLLRESLSDYKSVTFTSDIGLAFIDVLPGEEALSLLQKRRAKIEEMLETVHLNEAHHGGFHLMIVHQKRHLAIELEWLDEVIAHIETS